MASWNVQEQNSLSLNSLSVNLKKWSNTLKQFVLFVSIKKLSPAATS